MVKEVYKVMGICIKSRKERIITRILNEEVRLRLEAQYEGPQSQKLYKLRKHKVKLSFGHIKHNLKVNSFLLRGLKGVNAEAPILASCFNLSWMIAFLVKELST
jgi:hypothetical protein